MFACLRRSFMMLRNPKSYVDLVVRCNDPSQIAWNGRCAASAVKTGSVKNGIFFVGP